MVKNFRLQKCGLRNDVAQTLLCIFTAFKKVIKMSSFWQKLWLETETVGFFNTILNSQNKEIGKMHLVAQRLLCIIAAFKKKTFIVNITDSPLWRLVAVGIIK